MKVKFPSRIIADLCIACAGMFAGWITASTAYGQTNNSPAGQNQFAPFEEIIDHNIFDPNRRGRVAVRPTPPPTQVPDQLQLVGTLITDSTTYAFFNGTRPEYNVVLLTGGLIASCTVEEIQASQITLQVNDQPLTVKVGMQLTRSGNEEWKISTTPSSFSSHQSFSNPSVNSARTSSPPSSGDDPAANDILKKLMERRKQEMGQ